MVFTDYTHWLLARSFVPPLGHRNPSAAVVVRGRDKETSELTQAQGGRQYDRSNLLGGILESPNGRVPYVR